MEEKIVFMDDTENIEEELHKPHMVKVKDDYIQTYEDKKLYSFLKRLQDIVFSSLALVVLCIPMLVVVIIILIDSPGAGAIFSQKRVGLRGKIFNFYKFRSMVPNAEDQLPDLMEDNEMDGPVFKIKDDPRITRFGRFIRKFCIDELPQLVNIFMGDMSIVGPRPPIVHEVENYTERNIQRLLVKPGLTCYWQIQPNRNGLSFDDWVELDIKYIKERSFLTDWKIIFKTIGVAFRGDGI